MKTHKHITQSQFHLTFALLAVCLTGWFTALAPRHAAAHGGGGDIALFSTAGQVDVGFAILDDDDDMQVFFDPDEDVFISVLLPVADNPIVPWDFGSPEPGFDADEGALPGEAAITYNLKRLWYWNGEGTVDFAPAVGMDGGVAPGSSETFADGGFHSHPFFGVDDPAGLAASGVYVGQLTVSVNGLADSEPYYMVSLISDAVNALPDDNEQAAQIAAGETIGELVRLYADDPSNPAPVYDGVDYSYFAAAVNHVRAIPEPATAWFAALGLLAVSPIRRRARTVKTAS